MSPEQAAVLDFHQKFDCTVNARPTLPSTKDAALRIDLILEEAEEFRTAVVKGDLVEIADALADLQYVLLGAAITYGIDLEPVFNEVHRSNMSKLWPGGVVKKREDGKVIKAPTYSPADIKPILCAQGMESDV